MKFLLILFLFQAILVAQEISKLHVLGNGTFLKSELIDKSIIDANGDVCAALMIQTDLTSLSYDSNNGIVKVNSNKGEDILFLSANERVVKILKSGYKPLQIILSEFDIRLKSGQMWKLEITGDKKSIYEGKGNLQINSNPSGATILIDGIPTFNEKTPFKANGFQSKYYTISIRKEFFKTIDTLILLKENSNKILNIKLQEDFGYLKLVSKDTQFSAYVDSVKIKNNFDLLKLSSGKHILRCTKEKYYKDFVLSFVISDIDRNGKVKKIDVKFEKYNITIKFNSKPETAIVLIDNSMIGVTPLETTLIAGSYNLSIRKNGYLSIDKKIDITGPNSESKNYTLTKEGLLYISGESGANVYLEDSVYIGTIPIIKKHIPAGFHKITIEKTGYYSETFDEEIIVNKKMVLDVNLTELGKTPFIIPTFTSDKLIGHFRGLSFSVGLFSVFSTELLWGVNLGYSYLPFQLEFTYGSKIGSDDNTEVNKKEQYFYSATFRFVPLVIRERFFFSSSLSYNNTYGKNIDVNYNLTEYNYDGYPTESEFKHIIYSYGAGVHLRISEQTMLAVKYEMPFDKLYSNYYKAELSLGFIF